MAKLARLYAICRIVHGCIDALDSKDSNLYSAEPSLFGLYSVASGCIFMAKRFNGSNDICPRVACGANTLKCVRRTNAHDVNCAFAIFGFMRFVYSCTYIWRNEVY